MLTETKVKLTTASGEDLGALGTVKVRGFLSGQRVEFEAVVARKAHKCLLRGVKLRENGYLLTLSSSSSSYIEKRGTRMNLACEGKRDIVNLTIYKKIKEANVEKLSR